MQVMSQIFASTLDQVSSEPTPLGRFVWSAHIVGKIPKLQIEQRKERTKGPFVSAVRGGGNQH